MSVVKQLSPDISRFFARQCPMFGVDFQACLGKHFEKKKLVFIGLFELIA